MATQHLIEQGHTKIAYVAGPQFKPDAYDRLQGHKRALEDANISFDTNLFYEGDFKETGGYKGFNSLIDNHAQFTGIVCANDEMASGVMKCARERGMSLPTELAIIGFDNVIFTNYLYPTLTTINNPIADMGRAAAQLVLNRVYKQTNVEIEQIFSPALISRQSTSLMTQC